MKCHKSRHKLTAGERRKLRAANKLLWLICAKHCHTCECVLCEARMLTDVQDEESYTVDGVIFDNMEEN